jgi:hypothetical protein
VAEGTDEAATASAFGNFFGNLNPFAGSGRPCASGGAAQTRRGPAEAQKIRIAHLAQSGTHASSWTGCNPTELTIFPQADQRTRNG